MELSGFYFITDDNLTKKGALADAKAAVAGGARVVQYREKKKNAIEFLTEACAIRDVCKSHNTLFLVNDEVWAAVLTGADGVHLGQDDMPAGTARRILGKGSIIGVTVHNVEEAVKAVKDGADYVGVSPIYQTATKKDAGKPAGLDVIGKVKSSVNVPVVAIGGINEENAGKVIAAGADALAAISATVTQDDVEAKVALFSHKFKRRI